MTSRYFASRTCCRQLGHVLSEWSKLAILDVIYSECDEYRIMQRTVLAIANPILYWEWCLC